MFEHSLPIIERTHQIKAPLPKDMDGWVKDYLKIILSFGIKLLAVSNEMGLPYKEYLDDVRQLTKRI